MNKKLIVAHRGDSTRAHENTLDAFRYAIECGADMIEFDVRRTADGQLVVHHDAEIAGRAIAEMEFREIAGVSAYPVALLSEVLDLAAGRIRMDVELKENGYEQEVVRQILDRRIDADGFAITSFSPAALDAVRGDARTGLLVENVSWEAALDLYERARVDFLAPDYRLVRDGSGVPLLPWTVNDAADIRRLLAMPDVFGVITDRPRDAVWLCSSRNIGSPF